DEVIAAFRPDPLQGIAQPVFPMHKFRVITRDLVADRTARDRIGGGAPHFLHLARRNRHRERTGIGAVKRADTRQLNGHGASSGSTYNIRASGWRQSGLDKRASIRKMTEPL